MKFFIDISTEEKKKEIIDLFKSLKTKTAVYKYFDVSDNSTNVKYLKYICDSIGFEFKKESECVNHCLFCGKEIPKRMKFCSMSHSAKYNNSKRGGHTKETKKKISDSLYIIHGNPEHKPRNKKKTKVCKICGDVLHHNDDSYICNHNKKWFKNLECFGFDVNKIGTKDVFCEFEKVKQLLYEEYFVNMLSVECIAKKYNYTKKIENLVHVLKNGFGFKLRSSSESTSVSIETGRYKINSSYTFKTGYRITWEGKRFFYRSSYEEKYSEYLDEHKIKYDYESLRIVYFDTEKGKVRIAIPDFFLLDSNEIVEVKSKVTFKKQNIIDKFEAYVKNGYIPLLNYEGRIYTFNEVKNDLQENDYLLGE